METCVPLETRIGHLRFVKICQELWVAQPESKDRPVDIFSQETSVDLEKNLNRGADQITALQFPDLEACSTLVQSLNSPFFPPHIA